MKHPKTPKDKTHFARILTLRQVNNCVNKLNEVSDVPYPLVKNKQDLFECKSPDGDTVFSGMLRGTHYICRLHKEVFKR